jgi:hypothetical protein
MRIEKFQCLQGLQQLIDTDALAKRDVAIGGGDKRAGGHAPFQERTVLVPFHLFLVAMGEIMEEACHRLLPPVAKTSIPCRHCHVNAVLPIPPIGRRCRVRQQLIEEGH